MRGGPAEVQAAPVAQEAAVVRPLDISELRAQALDTYRREVAGGEWAAHAASGMEADVGELIAQALAANRPRVDVSAPDVTTSVEEAKEELSGEAASEGPSTERGVAGMQERVADDGRVESRGERAEVEGVEDSMWEWRELRKLAPGEPCPAGLVYSMDLNAGTSCAPLPDNLRARLEAVKAARSRGAGERPLAPFPPRPESPPAVIAAGGEEEIVREAESVEDEEAYGPGEPSCTRMTPGPTSTPAWTWTRRTHRCCPCPPRCRPLPWGALSSGAARSMRPRVPVGTTS